MVVISDARTAIGITPAKHDISGLVGERLRTHGGLAEAKVPFVLNYPLYEVYARRAARGRLQHHGAIPRGARGALRIRAAR